MRRFWSNATAVPRDGISVVAGDRDELFVVLLDANPLRLPGGAPLAVPHRALAEAIAREWAAANATLMPDDLPLTRLAGAAIERIAPDPDGSRRRLLAYGKTDLLCYRAETPVELADLQHANWQPWLDWAATAHAARLHPTSGIIAIDQPDDARAALAKFLANQDQWTLAGLATMVPALGSLILGLAVIAGALSPAGAHTIAILDETWQERQWGADAGTLARRRGVARDVASAAEFVTLTRT